MTTLSRNILLSGISTLSIALGCASMASAADQPVQTAETAVTELDSVIVLGTRRTDRSVVDSPSPIDVFGGDELSRQPAADMLDVVKNIVPSFYVPQNTISDASTFVRAPSLRGLGAIRSS